VAFSCKGRICPSCWARRAADIAADLVDRLLPQAPYRQFVLTFPWPLRFPLAFDATLLTRMMRAYLNTLFAWMRRRGRELGIRGGRTGAVTFIQRFGGALNLNPHLHSLIPDGLFVPDPETPDRLAFTPLPPPTDTEIEQLTVRIARRLIKLAVAAGVGRDEGIQPDDEEQMLLARSMSEAMVPLLSPTFFDAMPAAPVHKHLCANVEGFGLHAARAVPAHDRAGLERLCRYGLRAPFSQDRLSLLPDGRVRYRLRRPWPTPDGASELVLDPVKFLKRLTALLARPYVNLVRYHGIFANRSNDRDRLPPPPAPSPEPLPDPLCEATPPCVPLPSTARRRRSSWAQLLKRVLHLDALTCPRCSVPMVVIAFITDPTVVSKILNHLHLPTADPPRAPARVPLEQMSFEAAFGEDFADEPFCAPPPLQRGPP
jgi:hypothetical protein